MSETGEQGTAEVSGDKTAGGEPGSPGDGAHGASEPGENGPADDAAAASEAEAGTSDSAPIGGSDEPVTAQRPEAARSIEGGEGADRDSGTYEPGENGPAEGDGDASAAGEAGDTAEPGEESPENGQIAGGVDSADTRTSEEPGESGPGEPEDGDTESAGVTDGAQADSGEAPGPDGDENSDAAEDPADGESPEGSDDTGSRSEAGESQNPEGTQYTQEPGDLQETDNEGEGSGRIESSGGDENSEGDGRADKATLSEPGERGPGEDDATGSGNRASDGKGRAGANGGGDAASVDGRQGTEAGEPAADEHDAEPGENPPAQGDEAHPSAQQPPPGRLNVSQSLRNPQQVAEGGSYGGVHALPGQSEGMYDLRPSPLTRGIEGNGLENPATRPDQSPGILAEPALDRTSSLPDRARDAGPHIEAGGWAVTHGAAVDTHIDSMPDRGDGQDPVTGTRGHDSPAGAASENAVQTGHTQPEHPVQPTQEQDVTYTTNDPAAGQGGPGGSGGALPTMPPSTEGGTTGSGSAEQRDGGSPPSNSPDPPDNPGGGGSPPPDPPDNPGDVSPEAQRIAELEAQLAQAKAELTQTKGELDQANQEIADLKAKGHEQGAPIEDVPPLPADTIRGREYQKARRGTDKRADTNEAERTRWRPSPADSAAITATLIDAGDTVVKIATHAMHDGMTPAAATGFGVLSLVLGKVSERRKEEKKE